MNRLLFYVKMGDKEIDAPNHWTIKKDFGFGKLNTRIKLGSPDQIDYAMHLTKQSSEGSADVPRYYKVIGVGCLGGTEFPLSGGRGNRG